MGQRRVPARVDQIARIGAVMACSLALAHCGKSSNIDSKYGVAASERVIDAGQPVPKGGGRYSVGKPYQIAGRTYTPEENSRYSATGIASWYGDDFHGRKTANGEIFDMNSIAAAHPTLPLPSYVRVTNLANNKSLVVRVNDRGPYHADRVLDVSVRAAQLLGFHSNGIAKVRVDYVGRAAIEGSDDAKLAATLRTGAPAAVMMASNATNDRFLASRSDRAFSREYFDPKPMVTASAEPAEAPPLVAKRVVTTAVTAQAPASHQNHQSGPVLASAESRPAPAPRQPYPAAPALASAESRPAAAPRAVWVEGPPSASFNSRFATGTALGSEPPVTAYAPVRSDNVVTGRGLY